MSHFHWNILPTPPAEQFSRIKDLPPLMVQLLYNRGIKTPEEAESFLSADEWLSGDPMLLPDMEKAVARLYRALLSGEEIAIYGDFDADGVSATALLVQALSSIGGRVTPYIPHRIEEGYGLNTVALEGLSKRGVSLVITVDCGISDIDEVKQAQRMGLDIIITDHHSIPPELPPAVASVNPKRADSNYPFLDLAGVGVALKLFQGLLKSLGREDDVDYLLDLVALGTVTDKVPLVGENRYLVKRGLRVLNNTNRPGLLEMAFLSGARMGRLDTESISWTLGPRLNAAGRVDRAITSYKLLVASSFDEAKELALLLEEKNAERQRLTEEVIASARGKHLATYVDSPLIMVSGEDYPAGVVGIAAGRLADEFHRPTIVIEQGQEVSRGSARSIPEFDIVSALRDSSDLLTRFGGHPLAAGFTLPTCNISSLHQRLLDMARRKLDGLDLRPQITIDAEMPLSSLSGKTIRMLNALSPYGYGNPPPTFLTRGVNVIECRSVGGRGEHLRLRLQDGEVRWHGIGFRLGQFIGEVRAELDIVYNIEVDEWAGGEMLELNILDFQPSASQGGA